MTNELSEFLIFQYFTVLKKGGKKKEKKERNHNHSLGITEQKLPSETYISHIHNFLKFNLYNIPHYKS